jgi:hypothetical protein
MKAESRKQKAESRKQKWPVSNSQFSEFQLSAFLISAFPSQQRPEA